ncbi:hypothetical protein [Alkalimarinus coralli]|uniref:hypothetical protein n=1 Tax=Alkalimarinus coralli TaxID=2935863 RepID=UPI00202B2A2B|nr:hypothetical protein [Alkalimarinus coralli]
MIPTMSGGAGGIDLSGGPATSGNGDYGANFGSTFNFAPPPVTVGGTSIPAWLIVAGVVGVFYLVKRK